MAKSTLVPLRPVATMVRLIAAPFTVGLVHHHREDF
jgi:hypothetical protein